MAPSVDGGLQAEVERLAGWEMQSTRRVGLAIGMIAEADQSVVCLGRVHLERPVSLNGDSIFEIGSITKVFTGLALADMAEEGLINLDDPVRMCLPPFVQLPRARGSHITLRDLATHTSGLPPFPRRLLRIAYKTPENPYSNLTVDDVYAALSRIWLRWPTSRQFRYSNLGGALLGHALATRTGHPYEQLVAERICRPLGMEDTFVALPFTKRDRAVQGYSPEFHPVPAWDFPVLQGAGALRSTINDLLRFLRSNLDPPDSRLGRAMELAQRRHVEVSKMTGVGLGWQVRTLPESRLSMVWHNGGTGGFRSFLGFVREKQAAVAVVSNSALSVDGVGTRLLETYVLSGSR